jgi:hypothetical protein
MSYFSFCQMGHFGKYEWFMDFGPLVELVGKSTACLEVGP